MSPVANDVGASFGKAFADGKRKMAKQLKAVVVPPACIGANAVRWRLKMTPRQFARHIGFSPGTLRKRERGHRPPEGAARVLLKVIDRRPGAVIEALGS